MQVDKLIFSTKARNSWQCFDLGCRVAIANFRQLFLFWLIVTLPIFIVVTYISPAWGLIIFWLFKPWYERGQLFILSRAVFGNKVSLLDVVKTWPSQIKPLWFSSVTLRRLSPSRSFDVPVAQLEGLTKERRRQRLQVLHNSRDNNIVWWTVCCVHWETFIAIAILMMFKILLPQEFDHVSIFDFINDNSSLVDYLVNISMYLAIALVAPFYVAGGFVAYLNRRIVLEAWDIEIGFKTWCKETKSKQHFNNSANSENHSLKTTKTTSNQKMSLTIVAILMCSTYFTHSNSAFAQGYTKNNKQIEYQQEAQNEATAPPLKNQTLRDEISVDLDLLFNQEPFGKKEVVTRYRLRQSDNKDDEKDVDNDSDSGFIEFLVMVAKFLANSIQIIFWAFLAFIVAYLVYRNKQLISNLFDNKSHDINEAPLPSFIAKAFNETLPKDVSDSVDSAIENQEFRRALSLLVRASLTKLSHLNTVHISKSMTENECLAELKKSIDENVFHYMSKLLQAWMKMAWAHQLPDTETLKALSRDYHLYFVENNDSQKGKAL